MVFFPYGYSVLLDYIVGKYKKQAAGFKLNMILTHTYGNGM